MTTARPPVDPRSGFCNETKTFHSLRPAVPLPPSTQPLSFVSYSFSLLPSPLPPNPALIDAATGAAISYPRFLSQVRSLAYSLTTDLGLSKGDVAFILSPARLDVPLLYYALLSIGAVVSPANPASTPSEIAYQFNLVNPSISFAVSSTASKLPPNSTTVLLDSPLFASLSTSTAPAQPPAEIRQADTAGIFFSSGTTGRVKAAAVPHRSFIAVISQLFSLSEGGARDVALLTAPMFHVMGVIGAMKGLAVGDTVVMVDRCGLMEMLRLVERYRVTELPAAPPVVVAMGRSEEVARFDLRALQAVRCGGAPLPVEAAKRFRERFPGAQIMQGYGSTEAGAISMMLDPAESCRLRSVGRLSANVEAKIVDYVSGETLSVGQQGELWVRGPATMIGYIGDPEANASSFDSNGWLKTGDLCYFDHEGFLYIVDRLKELIKYKAYQVPPAELEDLLQSLPGVTDAAVIPYPHEEAGEIPMAYVVRQQGSNLSEAEIMDFVARQVAPYKKIRKVAFISSIPKSAAGKILRRELVNLARFGSLSRLKFVNIINE